MEGTSGLSFEMKNGEGDGRDGLGIGTTGHRASGVFVREPGAEE
jgi:hypothetical protein